MNKKGLIDYWLILYRKRWLILSVMISAMISTTFLCKLLTPIYESEAVFFVPEKPDVVSFLTAASGEMVRTPVLPEVAEEPHSPYLGILKSKAIRELVQKDFPHKTIGDLYSDVDFSLSSEYMIKVFARDTDPVKAAGIANAYVQYLNEILGGFSRSLVSRSRIIIENQLINTRRRLSETRGVLKEFQQSSGFISPAQENNRLSSLKITFQSRLNDIKIALQENQSKIVALKKKMEEESKLYQSTELIVGSPLMNKLRQQLSNLEVKIALRKDAYQTMRSSGVRDSRVKHNDEIMLQNEYNQVEKAFNAEIERMSKSQIKHPDTSYEVMRRSFVNLSVENEKNQASIRAYNILISNVDEKLLEMPELMVQEESLQMDIARYREMVKTLEVKLEEAKMQNERLPQVAIVVGKATPNSNPSYPVLSLDVMIAGVLGLIGGVFYSFFVNYLDETKGDRICKLVMAIEASEG